MADYTVTKTGQGGLYPINGADSAWNRLEPLITPDKLKNEHLFGIPLISGFKDPITKRVAVMTDPTVQSFIDRAVGIAEAETGLELFPTAIEEKYPFDKNEYESYGFFRLQHKPVKSIEGISVSLANDVQAYIVPLEWVETGQLYKGQVNIIPLTIALRSDGRQVIPPASTPGSAMFLAMLSSRNWLGSFWLIKYTTGFPDGMLPKQVNELIGTIAAMEVLSALAPTYAKANSMSLGMDGLSQSTSNPGPELFAVRIQDLMAKRQMLVQKLKAMYGSKFVINNI